MAHELDNSTGKYALASTDKEWHFGETQHALILPGDDLDTIINKAGLNYTIKRARVRYNTAPVGHPAHTVREVDDRVVQFRSDTFQDLGIVSDSFETVQPRETVETIYRYCEEGGATMKSLGAVFGGRRYFATAKIGDDVSVGKGDILTPFITIWTACDGSLATEVDWTSFAAVCNNTLSALIAGAEKSTTKYRQTHRSKFKADKARQTIEASNAEFRAFVEAARELAAARVSAKAAETFFAELLAGSQEPADLEKAKEQRAFPALLALYNGKGKGSDLTCRKGTAWGLVNAVTDYVDHSVRARSDDHRLVSAQSGPGAALKQRAFNLAAQGVLV